MASAARREAMVYRMTERFKVELAAFHAASTALERAKVLVRIYRKGYMNGSQAAYYRYVLAGRKQQAS